MSRLFHRTSHLENIKIGPRPSVIVKLTLSYAAAVVLSC